MMNVNRFALLSGRRWKQLLTSAHAGKQVSCRFQRRSFKTHPRHLAYAKELFLGQVNKVTQWLSRVHLKSVGRFSNGQEQPWAPAAQTTSTGVWTRRERERGGDGNVDEFRHTMSFIIIIVIVVNSCVGLRGYSFKNCFITLLTHNIFVFGYYFMKKYPIVRHQ